MVESHDYVKELQAFHPLSETEVHNVIKKLQKKSCELDHIPTYIVKNHLDYFIKSYMHIVNLPLVNGEFADTWKCAILRPLIKKQGAGMMKTNYHSVSNLSFLLKVTEKCVQEQFSEHWVVAMKNSEYQSAYKEGHSCKTALIKILNDLLWAMENKISALVLLDLSSAFDTVDHDILL